MTYWHMSLYPNNNRDWNRELELLEKKSLIGIGLNREENNPQIEQFKKMEEGDVVLIKDRFQSPLALVQIIGKNEEIEQINNDLDWFVFRRKIKIVTLTIKEKLNFRLPPARFSKSKNKNTPLYQFIDKIYNDISPTEENMNLISIDDYMENFILDMEILKKLIEEKKYTIDETNNMFYTELLEFYKEQLIEINSISVQIENVKSINKLNENFRIDFNNKIYSIVGNNGIGKSALLVVLGQLVNQTYFSYEFKGNAYDDSKITFIFNDIIKFEWKKYSTKTNTKRWSLETKNSLGDMPRINGFFESGIISGTRFENLNEKKQVLNLVEKNTLLKNEIVDSSKIKFIKENLNYIINNNNNINKYETLFTAEVDISFINERTKEKKIKKVAKFFYRNKNQQVISEYSFSTGEYFVLSLLTFIYQYIDDSKESLIIIDEIDISLHPLAQRRLLEKIKFFAKKFKITFVIATHSLQIIENLKADDIHYIENNNGNIFISNPIFPAYVTRNIYEHMYYDKVILVEDTLAKLFLENVINNLKKKQKINLVHFQIIEIGGWRKVIETVIENKTLAYYSKAKVIAILDKDIENEVESFKDKIDVSEIKYIPVEKNMEWFTIKKLLSEQNFKRMIEDELIKPNSFSKLLIKGPENNTKEIKNKFKNNQNSLIKQIGDFSNGKSYEEIEKKIIHFIYEKIEIENLENEYVKFENMLEKFLNTK